VKGCGGGGGGLAWLGLMSWSVMGSRRRRRRRRRVGVPEIYEE
jgi:uncharacterized protein (TIGR03382 family)